MDNKENKGDKEVVVTVPGLFESRKSYIEDFLGEIRENLEDIELELVNLEMDPGNKDCVNSIYCSFHTIRSLTGLLNSPSGTEIAIATEELLDAARKNDPIIAKNIITLILDSVNYIKKICTDALIISDDQFKLEIDRHIQNIKKIKDDIILEGFPLESSPFSGETYVRKRSIDPSKVEEVLDRQTSIYNKMKFGEIILREKKADASDIIKSIRMQKVRNNGATDQYVKIPLERLDQIIDIIQNVENIYNYVKDEIVLRFGNNDSLTIESSKAYFLINDVKNILKELRMVTLQQAFQKLTRSVCSIIEENHLEVKFSTMGENIEVEKEFSDRIDLPMGDLVKLLIDKAYTNCSSDSQRAGNIEVIAYEDGDTIHIDIIGDAPIDLEDFRLDPHFIDTAQNLNSLKCRLDLNDMNGKGVKISIIMQK